MAKAEQVLPTGLSDKSKVYTVKKKEEELRAALEQTRLEAQKLRDDARAQADQITEDTQASFSDIIQKAFEDAASGAEDRLQEILGSRDDRIQSVNKAAEQDRNTAIEAGLSLLLSE